MADHCGLGVVENICKESSDADVWSRGLKSLISSDEGQRSKIDGLTDGGLCFNAWSHPDIFQDARDLISTSPSESSISTILDFPSPDNHHNITSLPVVSSFENLMQLKILDAANMNVKGASSDVYRVSVSSAPSTSSHGSAQDDCDALGDVYMWGEVIFEATPRNGTETDQSFSTGRTDILLPRPLESNLVLDVHHVACGVKHAALVTKQGEVFTWGEESGGRLGHGNGMDVIHPRLLESFTVSNAEFVACGEFHTCVVTTSGEVYSWGDGTHNVGLLGHGSTVSHWIPKRVSGPLEGLQVTYVTCGTWHTALIAASGQLFTFGDGSFGALGHGNRDTFSQPKEVESLMGLRTTAVACGVWHTAAVVEVIVAESSTTAASGKLFTWGDGDKYRLGHGDKEPRVKPTCVASLIEYNFYKVACGHSITIGLTTAGHVCTMGSSVYGQLGNPQSDGKLPQFVQDKLLDESVTDISCGSYHVAVLTARNEVFTWGKGANGRLGHGDFLDRKTPTLVEALKDRSVKQIACGANFTAAICQHKWVSGADQSQCSSCRQAFGFTRKRHNCYHCGLVHCHSCSSRKALRAALSPNPGKPYRVCDSCFVKLNSVLEPGGANKRSGLPRFSNESKDRFEKADLRLSKTSVPTNLDLIKNLDSKAARHVKKVDSLSLVRPLQVSSLLQFKDIPFATGVDLPRAAPRSVRTSKVQSLNPSRAVSPFSRRPSPPRSATPVPTTGGLSFSKSATDGLKKANELLNQEVKMLRAQVETLRQRCELQEIELQTSAKKAQEAMTLASEESVKAKAAKEVIKSLTAQLKDMADRLPPGFFESDVMRHPKLANGIDSLAFHGPFLNGEKQLRDNVNDVPAKLLNAVKSSPNGSHLQSYSPMSIHEETKSSPILQAHRLFNSSALDNLSTGQHDNNAVRLSSSSRAEVGNMGTESPQNGESISKSRSPILSNNQGEPEWIEQYEPGVYITLMALHDGTRDLKRVRFSRRRFGEHQAEAWWSENREKVYGRYNVRGSDRSSSATSTQSARQSEEFVHPST